MFPVTSVGLVIFWPGVNGVPVVAIVSGLVFPCVHWYFKLPSFIPASFAPSVGFTVTLYDWFQLPVFPFGSNVTVGLLLSMLNGPMSSTDWFPNSSSAYIHKCQLSPVSPSGVVIGEFGVNVVPPCNCSSVGLPSPFTHTYFGISLASPEFGSCTSTVTVCDCSGVVKSPCGGVITGPLLSIANGPTVIMSSFPYSSSTFTCKYQSSPVASSGLGIMVLPSSPPPITTSVPLSIVSGGFGSCVHSYFISFISSSSPSGNVSSTS